MAGFPRYLPRAAGFAALPRAAGFAALRRAGGIAALVLSCSGAPALGATLPVGGAAAIPRDAAVLGTAAPQRPLSVTFALRPRDPAALAAFAGAVSTPGSPVYRRFLTPAEFARRFGAGAGAIDRLRAWLRHRGLPSGHVGAGGLSVALTAPIGAIERGLGVTLARLSLPGGRRALATRRPPIVPAGVAGTVQSVVGLDTVAARRPLLARPQAVHARRSATAPHVITGGPQPCPAATGAATAQGAYTADQIASAYGLSGLYAGGDRGAGTTVALYELEPVSAGDLASYAACYGIQPSIGYVSVDGGAGSGAGSGEAALDIENVMGLAPAANLLVYQGPNSNSGSPGAGPYDTFAAIINQDRAQVVSVSWGECESALGSASAQAENSLFEQAAAQGQTIVSAAGDSGSEDCDAGRSVPATQLAVDDPSSQPLVMGVGGTTLSALGPRPTESVWNAGGSLARGLLAPGAGGGGISNLWAMPAAQRSAAGGLNVLGAGPTGAQCDSPGGYCRQTPDVAADADPNDGYLIYFNGSGQTPGQSQGWQAIGGTSAAAPVWSALIALTDAAPACQQTPLGYALPALYRAAGANYPGTFNDVQVGNNDFTATNGGQFAAAPGYDEASGLGSPNGASLATALCADSLRLIAPPTQHSTAGAAVRLTLRGQDVAGSGLQFSVHGLPLGLGLDANSGVISGAPRIPGIYRVTVLGHDAAAATAATAFTWQVGGPVRVRNVRLTGGARPQLSLTVAAGSNAPPLRSVTLTLPASLGARSARGVRVDVSSRVRALARTRRVAGTFVIALRRGYRSIQVSLSASAITLRSGRQARARSRTAGLLGVRVTDAGGGISMLRSRPRPGRG